MTSIFMVNFIMTFFIFFTLLYHIPSVAASLDDPSTYPAVYVLRHSMSTRWMTALLSVIIVLLMCHNITYLTATSRDLFAFARDRGVPISTWLSTINKRTSVPANACIFTGVVSSCLALVYIGSVVAFYAMTSLFLVSLLQCYCLSIGCMLWRRIFKPDTLPPARYSLGRWGIPINLLAVLYSFWCFIWAFWPQKQPVTATGFNWSSVLFSATLLVALVYFVAVARKIYTGPVALVKGRKKAQ
jgi:amino acid transporter